MPRTVAEQSAEAAASHCLHGSASHLTFLQTKQCESYLRPGNPNDIQTITILGLLFALVTIIGGIHPEIYRHLPNPGLRLGCFNFVIVPVLAWIIVRILGGMAVATSFEKAFGKTPSPRTDLWIPQ